METAIREKLPNRRKGYNHKLIIGDNRVYLRTGEYDDGRLGEIFVSVEKCGSSLSAWVNLFCISVSISLQSGVPLEFFVEKFLFSKFEPSGLVQNHPDIKFCTSIADAIFRDLAINYLDRKDLKTSVELPGLQDTP